MRWVATIYHAACTCSVAAAACGAASGMTADSFVRACLRCGVVRLQALTPVTVAATVAAGVSGLGLGAAAGQAGSGVGMGVGLSPGPAFSPYALLPPPPTPPPPHNPPPPPDRPRSVDAALVLEQLSGISPEEEGL
jgi:hypothetical protein